MDALRIQRHFVAAMAKHLPPSASALRLLDLDGRSGAMLTEWRGDLEIEHLTPADLRQSRHAKDSHDAVVAFDIELDTDLLRNVLELLRPGGRFITIQSRESVNESHLRMLEDHGYVRILVEPALDGLGVLLRGEKPHDTADTMQRIRSVATADDDLLNLANFNGRYVHLLIQQRPNKPVWKLEESEQISWRAAAIIRDARPVLLAFSSLPKAVGFMQPAILAGSIHDINKVGKFSKQTAQAWSQDLILNPTPDLLRDQAITYVAIDPASAEAPDE